MGSGIFTSGCRYSRRCPLLLPELIGPAVDELHLATTTFAYVWFNPHPLKHYFLPGFTFG